MPIMETIRRGTDSTFMKIVFGGIVLVFVFWGVGAQGPTSVTIATVNGSRITDTQFQRIMRRVDRGGSMDEADRKQLQQSVIKELIQAEVMLQEADMLDIEVSDEEIARKVLEVDDFKDSDGRFSAKYYDKALKRYGLTQGGFESQLREQLTLQKLEEIAAAGATVNNAILEQLFRESMTRMDLSYVYIPDAALLSQVPIDDNALAAFVDTNADQIRLQYDKDFDRLYNEPPKATLSLILLRSDLDEGNVDQAELRTRMESIRARAVNGDDFGTLARTFSEDLTAVNGGFLGTMSETQMDKAVANAVFETEAGKVSEIVETARGLQLLLVSERIDARTTPLDEVKADIARAIIAEQGVTQVAKDFGEKVRTTWKDSGEPPAELLTGVGLEVDASLAVSPSSPTLGAVNPSPAMLGALKSASTEGVLDGVYEVEGGRVVVAVTKYEGADMDLFEAEKDSLRMRVRLQEQQLFVEQWRKDLVARAQVEQLWIP